MLRLTAEARKIVTDAKSVGVLLYATPQYAEFLKGHTHNLIPPTFTTAPGLDVLNPRQGLGGFAEPTLAVRIKSGGDTYEDNFFFDRSPDEVVQIIVIRYGLSKKAFTVEDKYTGVVLATYTPPKVLIPVYMNGLHQPNILVYSTDTKAEREEAIRKYMGNWSTDRYQFGDEAPYFYTPDVAHPVNVRAVGTAHPSRFLTKNPTLELPAIVKTPGVYEWSYQDVKPVWTRFTVERPIMHATLYCGDERRPAVVFSAPPNADDAKLYALADEALKKAGHRPTIRMDGRNLS